MSVLMTEEDVNVGISLYIYALTRIYCFYLFIRSLIISPGGMKSNYDILLYLTISEKNPIFGPYEENNVLLCLKQNVHFKLWLCPSLL